MIQETIAGELRTLRPDDPGNWLTNGETFSQLVILGKEDSPDNWNETTAGPVKYTQTEKDDFLEGLMEGLGV